MRASPRWSRARALSPIWHDLNLLRPRCRCDRDHMAEAPDRCSRGERPNDDDDQRAQAMRERERAPFRRPPRSSPPRLERPRTRGSASVLSIERSSRTSYPERSRRSTTSRPVTSPGVQRCQSVARSEKPRSWSAARVTYVFGPGCARVMRACYEPYRRRRSKTSDAAPPSE